MAGVSLPRDAAMPVLPSRFATVILHFAALIYHRSWRQAAVLMSGAILAPGRRTVVSLLRICGLMHERHFVNYHRVLNRAAWSPLLASRRLCCTDGRCGCTEPRLCRGHTMRTYSARPSAS